jgi:hypothetical protein
MKVKIAISFSVVLLFCQCRKDKACTPVQICENLTENADSIATYLPNKWQWVESKQIDRGGNITYSYPETAGYSSKLILKSDT